MGNKSGGGSNCGEAVWLSAPATRFSVALLAPTSRGGPVRDRDGVEMDCANSGEPWFVGPKLIRYCGPVAKFVSCPRAMPTAEMTSKVQHKGTRIEPSAVQRLLGIIMRQIKRPRQSRSTLLCAAVEAFGLDCL